LKFSGPELVRILMTLVTLVAVIFLAKPCGKQVSNFVMGYGSGSGSASSPKPGTVEPPPPPENIDQYEQLKPGMSEQEIKAAIERSKARNAAGSAAVPPTPAVPAPTGSAAVSPGAVPAAGSAASPRAGSAQR